MLLILFVTDIHNCRDTFLKLKAGVIEAEPVLLLLTATQLSRGAAHANCNPSERRVCIVILES